jgi:hypothetical protein
MQQNKEVKAMCRQRSSQSLSLPILAENCPTIVRALHIFQRLFRYNGGMKEQDGTDTACISCSNGNYAAPLLL